MSEHRFSKSRTLLLELAAAIALFAVAAGICARVLTSAYTLSADAEELSRGVEAVTAAAELLRSSWEEDRALAALEEDPRLEIQRREDRGLITYAITYVSEGEAIYTLELVRSGEAEP